MKAPEGLLGKLHMLPKLSEIVDFHLPFEWWRTGT
jgi:hypothetical protein